MKKTAVILGVVVTVLIAGGWLFFTRGGYKPVPLSESEKKVLDVQDQRLTKGDESAPVKIVEYADILCPYCAKVNEQIIPQIQSDYVDKKQAHYEVRLVAMIAPDSERAGEGAYCAAEQNKFWNYMDLAYKETWNSFYSKGKSPQDVDLFSERNIYDFAKRVGLNTQSWHTCMNSDSYQQIMAANQEKMNEIEAYGTPHFIINGSNYNGAPPYSYFKAAIEDELNKQKANP